MICLFTVIVSRLYKSQPLYSAMQSSHLICQITTYVPYLNEPWKLSNYYQ